MRNIERHEGFRFLSQTTQYKYKMFHELVSQFQAIVMEKGKKRKKKKEKKKERKKKKDEEDYEEREGEGGLVHLSILYPPFVFKHLLFPDASIETSLGVLGPDAELLSSLHSAHSWPVGEGIVSTLWECWACLFLASLTGPSFSHVTNLLVVPRREEKRKRNGERERGGKRQCIPFNTMRNAILC